MQQGITRNDLLKAIDEYLKKGGVIRKVETVEGKEWLKDVGCDKSPYARLREIDELTY